MTGEGIVRAGAIEAQGLARATSGISDGQRCLWGGVGECVAVGIASGAIAIAIEQFA